MISCDMSCDQCQERICYTQEEPDVPSLQIYAKKRSITLSSVKLPGGHEIPHQCAKYRLAARSTTEHIDKNTSKITVVNIQGNESAIMSQAQHGRAEKQK